MKKKNDEFRYTIDILKGISVFLIIQIHYPSTISGYRISILRSIFFDREKIHSANGI